MKLVIMTKSTFFVEEDKILTALFDEGMDKLHLYKPGSQLGKTVVVNPRRISRQDCGTRAFQAEKRIRLGRNTPQQADGDCAKRHQRENKQNLRRPRFAQRHEEKQQLRFLTTHIQLCG